MPEKINKKRCNFTIDQRIFKKFREYCKQNCINMSAKIESYIKKETGKLKN